MDKLFILLLFLFDHLVVEANRFQKVVGRIGGFGDRSIGLLLVDTQIDDIIADTSVLDTDLVFGIQNILDWSFEALKDTRLINRRMLVFVLLAIKLA